MPPDPLTTIVDGRRPAASIDELLAGATHRAPMPPPADGLSNAPLERVVIGGERYVLKHLHVDDDWVARASGDVTCRPLAVWSSRLLDALPPVIDHTIVGCAAGLGRNGWGAAVLMRDVGAWFVPAGHSRLLFEHHRQFLDHLAAMHASYWGWHDDVGLMPLATRYLSFGPRTGEVERDRGGRDHVPQLIRPGWQRVRDDAPEAFVVLAPLLDDPSPLVAALTSTPSTFLHGDWKAGNLGVTPDGRTILVDWAVPGEGSPCVDLAWYLAVNCDRLPESKEAVIAAYRSRLEHHGVATAGWFDRALELSLLGATLQLGWSKHDAELTWWLDRVIGTARGLA